MTVDLAGRRTGPISHINVTPMADVMIVLLIIFMVTVPALTREVDLPDAAHARDHRNSGIAVTVRANGSIVVGGEGTIDATELANRLRTRLGHEARIVHIHADERLAYARVEAVMEACRTAGAAEVALVAENRIGD